MKPSAEPLPPCVYLLADHLDAALAAGEDLLATRTEPCTGNHDATDAWTRQRAAERTTLDRAHALELALVARLLKARERAAELATFDGRFQSLARLFTASLVPLAEAAADYADATEFDFDTGGSAAAYLRSRGLLADDDAGRPERRALAVDDAFLVVGRMPLGTLLDLVATFLDTLERYYELYGDDDAAADTAAETKDGGTEVAAA